MAQSVAYFTGFETGSVTEIGDQTAGSGIPGVAHNVQTSTVISGAYSFKINAGNANLSYFFYLSGSQATGRFKFRQSALQAGGTIRALFRYASGTLGSPTRQCTLVITTATNKLAFIDSNSILGTITGSLDGNIVIAANTTYQIEMAVDLAAGGVIKVWVDGVLDIDCTHATNASGTAFTQMALGSATVGTGDNYYDDIRLDVGGVAQIGNGRVIARQIMAGTPTYNSWTAQGGSTVDTCWSNTPFDTVNYMDTTTLNAAQTGLISSFSATQSGHGTEIINTGATINGCQVLLVAKTSATAGGAGAGNIRRRVSGADVDSARTLTTSDVVYRSNVFTAALASLNQYEIGFVHGGVAATHTVRDAWMMVDYTGAYSLTSAVGAYVLTGITTLFKKTLSIAASVGAYTLTGVAAAFSWGRKVLANTGSYTLTGVAAALNKALKITAAVGSYTLTGVSSALLRGYTLVATKGTYVLSGVAAALNKALKMAAVTGVYNLSGQVANLVWSVADTATGGLDWIRRRRRTNR